MSLQQFSNPKRYFFPLAILLYTIILIILLIWFIRLKPSEPAEITRVTFNKTENILIISGENLPSNFSAVLTPNMQREHDTLSSRFTWGRAFNIAGDKNHLWVANAPSEILSYSIINPKKPVLTGVLSLNVDFKAWNITIEKDRALIAGGTSGLAYIDISDPSTPQHKFTINPKETIMDSTIKDDLAIIVTAKQGLILLDIHDDTPKEISKINIEGTLRSIYQNGNRAYVLGSKNKKGVLHIIDITHPRKAKRITTIELPHPATQFAQIDDTIFISMGIKGLYIATINSLTQEIGSYRIEDISTFGICAVDHDIYISNGSHHIYHYRTDNYKLTHIKTFLTTGKCQSLLLFNNYLIACLGEKGFAIFDPSKQNTTPQAKIDLNKTYGRALNILHRDKHFAISSNYRLNLFTESENGSISQYDSINFAARITAITMDHRYVYVALQNNEIHIINLNPSVLIRTKKIITWTEYVEKLIVDKSKLYLGTKLVGIFVLNLEESNISQEITPFISLPHDNYVIKDNRLYLATRPYGLKIYQINKKTLPLLIGELKYPATVEESSRTRGMVIKDGYALISNGKRGLLSVDIRDPKKPIIGDALDLSGYCNQIAVQGNNAYITTNRTKTTVVDISDPLKMKILCELPTTTAVAFNDNRIYQINDIGVYINSLPQPLKIKSQSKNLVEFELPTEATEGYYDLQLATTQQLTKYSDLLHYSPHQNWTMTREPTPSITNH